MTLDLVFDIIATERNYQARRWGQRQWNGTFEEVPHSVGDFLTYMQDYLTETIHLASRENGDSKSLDSLRKVVALGIACFQQHGVPARNPNTPCINGRDGLPA